MAKRIDPAFAEWQRLQPPSITGDSLWLLDCYREALFALHLVKEDVGQAGSRAGSPTRSDQLITSVASTCANIAEGYGRTTNADRRRFYSYALGSAREAVIWYQSVPIAPDKLANRLDRLGSIKQMLLGILKRLGGSTKPFEPW